MSIKPSIGYNNYFIVENYDQVLDMNHIPTLKKRDGIERTFLITDVPSIKFLYKKVKKNHHYDMEIDLENKIIYITQDVINVMYNKEHKKEERLYDNTHYHIKDFTDYRLFLTYTYRDHLFEHLSPLNYTKIIFYILIFMILILALVYYLIKTERINVENLKASISSIQKSITDTLSGNK